MYNRKRTSIIIFKNANKQIKIIKTTIATGHKHWSIKKIKFTIDILISVTNITQHIQHKILGIEQKLDGNRFKAYRSNQASRIHSKLITNPNLYDK